jgi:hypothetical protein
LSVTAKKSKKDFPSFFRPVFLIIHATSNASILTLYPSPFLIFF